MAAVISCSRRTDIPAFYTPWLIGRLRAGYCHTLNPFGGQIYRVSLRPEDVLVLTFWTRNPAPMAKYLGEMEASGYQFYFSMSMLGYPRAIEPHSPPLEDALRTFRGFSERISPERMRWRYDPIVLSQATPADYHLRRFEEMARALEGYTGHCTFSFVQYYGKTARNLGEAARATKLQLDQPALQEQQELARQLAEIARAHGISLNSCCNNLLAVEGVSRAHCVDAQLIQKMVPGSAQALKPKPTRSDCGCAASVDIGAYDTCLFGCAYCYATNSQSAARKRHAEHDPADSLLWRPETLHGADLDQVAVPLKGK